MLTFKMSRKRALELGLLICKCCHFNNSHFEDGTGSCAHCNCKAYAESAISQVYLESAS